MKDVYVGSFTGSAAAVNVSCGFVPSAVLFFEGGASPSLAMCIVDGGGVEQVAATTTANTDITSYDDGFTVAAGSAFNENTITTNFIAFRSDR